MIELNNLKITGNLVAIAETREGQAKGETFTTARILHSDSYKDQESGEWKQTEPIGLDLVIQGKYGEAFTKATEKGTSVYVEGQLKPNNWEDADGKHYGMRIKVSNWQIQQRPEKKATKKAARKG